MCPTRPPVTASPVRTAPSAGIAASRKPAAPFTPFPTGRNLDMTAALPAFSDDYAAESTPELSATRELVATASLTAVSAPRADHQLEMPSPPPSFYREDANGSSTPLPSAKGAAPSI